MTAELFDRRLRALRRDRAARQGPEMVLLDRAFNECLDRLHDIQRLVDRALLIGAPTPQWSRQLGQLVRTVDVLDPGPLFATASNGTAVDEDRYDYGETRYDLVIAVGTLDSVNELPLALQLVRRAMRPDAPFLGALAGGASLPALRAAMIEADRATGPVAARTHPRIEPASLAGLLSAAGFVMPVVDIDHVIMRYGTLSALVGDLRAMGATNILSDRSAGRGKRWAARASAAFTAQAIDGRVEERIDILYFLAWSPPH